MALVHCHFFSNVLKLSTAMDVILPQGTGEGMTGGAEHASSSGGFPCLLLLHGLSDDHTAWLRRTSIERYAAPRGLAVVMPSVHRSFYTDQVHGYPYWRFVSEEVLAAARYFFRISSRREDTFVAGISMGGYGAFKLALRRPERFAAAASLSGVLDVASYVSGMYSRDVALAFGDPPRVAGTENDLMHLVQQYARRKDVPVKFFQSCGTADPLYRGNIRFREHASNLGLDITYEECGCGHEWSCWDATIQKVLDWLPLHGGT